MSARRLSRTAGQGRSAAPVRLVHLGLGNFFRAHQCWYTEHAPDAAQWGIAGFTGRGSQSLVDHLTEQQGLYTLVTRARDADQFEVLGGLSGIHVAADNDAWVRYFESPELAAVTITVTEAGYLRGADGGLDTGRPEVQADIQVLRADPTGIVRTAPARLVAGLAARRRAGAGPIALVPCDNVPGNGALAERVVRDLAELVDDKLVAWLTDSVAVVTTMVDRITPATTTQDVRAVYAATGFEDRCPVVTEPFREWVLSGTFPAGKPRWEDAGATFTHDITPYEHRKLWLLNGAHSLLAYAGSIRGHETVPAAIADETCRSWVEEWWAVASPHLDQPAADIAAYRAALLQRFSNAADAATGCIASPLTGRRSSRSASCPSCGPSAPRAVCPPPPPGSSPRGSATCGAPAPPVSDARADEVVPLAAGRLAAAVPRVLGWLDPAIGADPDVVSTVVDQSEEFSRAEHVAGRSAAQR